MNVRLLLALVAAVSASPTAAASPVLVAALHARPADRTALRRAVETIQKSALKSWRSDGMLTGYRLLFARYPDAGQWDALELLHFKDEAALAKWRGAAGEPFAPQILALAQSVETTPGNVVRAEGVTSHNPAVVVIPYETLVPPGDYVAYLDGYTIPQFRGWMRAGVLDGYDILTSSYPAGRPWNALITLRYRDDAALGRRDEVVQSTRAALSSDPSWKTYADSKKNVRTERALAVADEVSAEGDVE